MKVLILGVNGFIGSALLARILSTTDWQVIGLDLGSHRIQPHLSNSRFEFKQGDFRKESEWIESKLQESDAVLPLVAVANPSFYVSDPIGVYELDFEANLTVVRMCVKHQKHLIFPSTSEVYGMSEDLPFDEENSRLVQGPIHKQRWIYSCSKQLMDRLIYAHGVRDQLNYTLFRPFNWIGAGLDNFLTPKAGSSRAYGQFLSNLIQGLPIQLVDGGAQRRCFTYIDDGIEALMRILAHKNDAANRQIFNVGNPYNNFSMRELASTMIEVMATFPQFQHQANNAQLQDVSAGSFFGESYQDVQDRVPSIERAQKLLGWTPQVDLKSAITRTLDIYLKAQS